MNQDQTKKWDLYTRIYDRAVKLGAVEARRQKVHYMLDLDAANDQHHLRLEDFAFADDFNFLHDFSGIVGHMDRSVGHITDGFVPRFAG